MFADCYRGKRVFLTGHTGFKGSWLALWLLRLGATVHGYADGVPTEPAHWTAADMESRMSWTRGDVRDGAALAGAMRDFAPDIVFHLAAQALVRRSHAEPARTIETNAMGTLNVLEAMRLCPDVRAGVLITSDKCYRNDEWVWGYRETDPLGGTDPYSASKGCAEIIARSYFESFFAKDGPACATVRAGNVIGGGDWAEDRIVPDCARAWAGGLPVAIRHPNATRPWQLVLEPLSGYLWLGAHLLGACGGPFPVRGEAYNFGPSADVKDTVGDVVRALAARWPGFSCEIAETGPAEAKECTLLKLCCDKALAHLDWKATLTFEESISFTADWYREFFRGGRDAGGVMEFGLDQIAAYERLAAERGRAWTR